MRSYAVVTENYLEDLGFLAVEWRALLFAPDVTPEEFGEHETRIEAFLDGLRYAGDDALPQIDAILDESDEPWEVQAAARAWLEITGAEPEQLIARLEAANPDTLGAWTEALRRRGRLPGTLPEAPAARAAMLAAAGWCAPLPWMELEAALDDAALRRAALRSIGASTDVRATTVLVAHVDDADPAVAAAALWGLCLAEPGAAHARLQSRVKNAATPLALRALGLFGDEPDFDALDAIARTGDAALRPAALLALGDLGFARALPTVLAALEDDEPVAAAAAAAYEMLTGVEVPESAADEEPPPSEGAEDEEDEEDEEDPTEEAPPGYVEPEWVEPPDEDEEEEASVTAASADGAPASVEEGDSADEEPPPVRDVAAARAAAPDADGRIRRGKPFGPAGDMAWQWRESVRKPTKKTTWHRREVPSGFLTGIDHADMRPGE